ncbi:hypothetical protein D3C87_1445760 [compost metagenome]
MSFNVFLEVERNIRRCNNTGEFVNMNEVIGISGNDTDQITVTVRTYTKHGIETENHTLSVAGTNMFRSYAHIRKTDEQVLEAEATERKRRYEE